MSKKYNMRFALARAAAALGIALVVALLLIYMSTPGASFGIRMSESFKALGVMLTRPIVKGNGSFSSRNFCSVLSGMIPIIFTGLATCVMFSANQFNLGAEGGIMLGAFITSLVAVYWHIPGALLPIVAILVGGIAVGALMYLPAILKAKLGVSEMVNSLMLNYVIMYVINYLMNTYLADTSKGQIQTEIYQPNAELPLLVENGSDLSIGFIIAIILAIVTWYFMYRTKWGYAIRMTGINQQFVMYSGMNVATVIILSQVLGGFLAGIGGGFESLGRYNAYSWVALPGYGWTGITVAILANNNPIYVPLAAFFISYLTKGCTLMSTYSSCPPQLIAIIQAVIFVFFAAEQFLSKYRQKLVVRSAKEEIEASKAEAKGGAM